MSARIEIGQKFRSNANASYVVEVTKLTEKRVTFRFGFAPYPTASASPEKFLKEYSPAA